MNHYCRKCEKETERDIRGVCRTCKNARLRKWRKANPEETRQSRIKQYQKNKTKELQANSSYYEAHADSIRQRRARRYKSNRDRELLNNVVWRKKNPDKLRKIKHREAIKRKYGLTKDDYEKMVLDQKNVCYLCKQTETHKSRLGVLHPLSVDHCHQTGKVRKLLCARCNHVLGRVSEDPQLLERMAEYLRLGHLCLSI